MTPSALLSRASHKVLLLVCVSCVVIAVLPSSGALSWVAFVVASVCVGLAIALVPKGREYGAAGLFVAAALKDGIRIADGQASVFHVLAVGLALASIAHLVRGRPQGATRISGLEWALAAPLVAGLWSLPASLDQASTLAYSGRLLLLWLVAVLVSTSLETDEARHRALAWLAASSSLLAAFALLQWAAPGLQIGHTAVQGNFQDLVLLTRPAGFYRDPNFLGAHLVLGALAGLLLASQGGKSWFWLAPVTLMVGVTALTYSRSSWLSLAVGLLVLVVLGPRTLRLPIIGVVLAATLAGAVMIGPARLLDRVTSTSNAIAGSSTATRLLMTQSMFEMILDRPVFGTGLEAFDEAYPEYLKEGARTDVTHPHQVPLALIAETGIAGLVTQVVLLWAVAASTRRLLKSALRMTDRAILAAVAAMLVGLVLQFFLYFELLWLVVALLAAAEKDAWPRAPVRGDTARVSQNRLGPSSASIVKDRVELVRGGSASVTCATGVGPTASSCSLRAFRGRSRDRGNVRPVPLDARSH